MTPAKNRCRDCRVPMTWRACRSQFGRLLRRGLSEARAKAILPRCQTCVTEYLREGNPLVLMS